MTSKHLAGEDTGNAMTFSGEWRVTFEEKPLFPFYGVPCGAAQFLTSVKNKHMPVQQSQQKRAPNAPKMQCWGGRKGGGEPGRGRQPFLCHFKDNKFFGCWQDAGRGTMTVTIFREEGYEIIWLL